MCLFLVLYWCSAVVKRCGGPNIFAEKFRFGDSNSRLGRFRFPVALLGELAGKELNWRTIFADKRRSSEENRRSSRFPREKPGLWLR
jgi:hypothetical protein